MKRSIKYVLGLTATLVIAPFLLSGSGSVQAQWAGPHYTEWSALEPVTSLNTDGNELPNCISRDGLRLYFHRGVSEDLYVAHRPDTESDWGTPVRLPDGINSPRNDRTAFESQDGHWLYFASNRDGGLGNYDLYVSWRKNLASDEAWQTPVNLAALNTTGFDAGPTLFEDSNGTTHLYFTSGATGPVADLYMSILGVDGFGPRIAVSELNSTANDSRPYIRKDGREVYFVSNRTGLQSIYASTRFATDEPWLTPEIIFAPTVGVPPSPPPYFTTPVLSRDALTLYVGVNQAAGTDYGDIYVTHRQKIRGPKDAFYDK